MGTINQIKEQQQTDTPLLMFQCTLPSGDIERWCSHGVFLNGAYFEARVLRHNLFDLQLSSDDAMDGLSQLSLTLANADSALSEINAAVGLKGSQLTVYFGFADLPSQQITSEYTVLFRGIAGDPDEITESEITISFQNKLSLQRIPVPEVRVQRTCPWNFPVTSAQRLEARDGGALGRFSRFIKCGYSADCSGGAGNLDPTGQPFTSCDKSRSQCEQRGMFNVDQNHATTRRFGGLEFVPSVINVRTSGDKSSHLSPVLSNTAKYNDCVPLVYGTAWLKAPIVFARNDGNLTHMEVLLGLGEITSVLKVVVNDVEIPAAVAGQDMTTSGWYSIFSSGSTVGSFNSDFLDASGNPVGDPYGSLAAMSVVVPNRISNGNSLPTVEVLMQGVKVDIFNANGDLLGPDFTNNPAWIILDLLRRCGWNLTEVSVPAFYSAAAHCEALISSTDVNGNTIQLPRYQCNLALTRRQSAATIIRGIRVGSSLMLRYGATGLLELLPETSISQQQPSAPDGTNSIEPFSGGWPAYEFGDGSNGFSGIMRGRSGESTVRLTSRSIAEGANRLSLEFQDEANEYQQDSLSVVDSTDSALIGYEIASQSTALGVANYNQASRVLLRQLDKTLRGNLFLEFQTSFRALRVRSGDIITVTYLKEGFDRVPFRVIKLSPSMNYQIVSIVAQIHNDDWYSDDLTVLRTAGRQPVATVQIPRALVGLVQRNYSDGSLYFDFRITEDVQTLTDGSATDMLTVSFAQPAKPSATAPRVPLVSLAPVVLRGQGALKGGLTYYYAVSAVDSAGEEGPLSFTVKAAVPGAEATNSVMLQNLSFPSNAETFNVYRGSSPQALYQISTRNQLSTTFIDSGFDCQPIGPPDASFDHANFYYRYEVAGPYLVSAAAATTLQCVDLGATVNTYSGMLVRIVDGTGKGQERSIASNTDTTLTIASAWATLPDSSSTFVICESAWRFAGVTAVSPIQFSVPYRAKSILQVTGRAANVHNQESAPELSPVTRIALGQSTPDFGVPGIPSYTLQAPGAGQLTLSNVGFTSDQNIASISSGTLNIYYWSELSPISNYLETGLDSTSTTISVSGPTLTLGTYVQAGAEILYLLSNGQSVGQYVALRGQMGSSSGVHSAQEPVVPLSDGKMVVPFATNFFQNRASINLIHAFNLPNVRVAAAQFFVSNGFGSSQVQTTSFVGNGTNGLRTLSGGQFNLQVSGYVTTQQSATPPMTVPAVHSIGDIYATLGQPASGFDTKIDLFRDGSFLCTLSVPAGSTISTRVDGSTLGYLEKGSLLTTAVTATPQTTFTGSPVPGKDLTLTIRL